MTEPRYGEITIEIQADDIDWPHHPYQSPDLFKYTITIDQAKQILKLAKTIKKNNNINSIIVESNGSEEWVHKIYDNNRYYEEHISNDEFILSIVVEKYQTNIQATLRRDDASEVICWSQMLISHQDLSSDFYIKYWGDPGDDIVAENIGIAANDGDMEIEILLSEVDSEYICWPSGFSFPDAFRYKLTREEAKKIIGLAELANKSDIIEGIKIDSNENEEWFYFRVLNCDEKDHRKNGEFNQEIDLSLIIDRNGVRLEAMTLESGNGSRPNLTCDLVHHRDISDHFGIPLPWETPIQAYGDKDPSP